MNEVRAAAEDIEAPVKYEGSQYQVLVKNCPVTKCENCGQTYYGSDSNGVIEQAIHAHLGLLLASQLRANREQLGLTQKQLAEQIRIAPETVSRWEKGHVIQSRSSDLLLRLYFGLPEARRFLRRCQDDSMAGAVVRMDRSAAWITEHADRTVLAAPPTSPLWTETWSSGGIKSVPEDGSRRDGHHLKLAG